MHPTVYLHAMQNATHTRLALRLPIQDYVTISQRAQSNGSDLFGYVAAQIGQKLTLTGMSFDLPDSCQHLRLTLAMPVGDAVKLHNLARSKDQSTTDWITALIAQGPLNVFPDREPLSNKKDLIK